MSRETVVEMKIALWPLAKVKAYKRNPRLHSDEEVRRLAEFVARLGFRKPIEVDEDGVVLAGHRRLAAAALLGLARVPVLQHRDLSAEEKRAYRIADNRLTLEGEWSAEHLHHEVKALGDFDLHGLGFTDAEIRRALEGLPSTVDEPEPAAEVEPDLPAAPAKPVTQAGDVWAIGEHRIACLDSLLKESRDRVFVTGTRSVARVDMVFTDPPYAIYGSSTGVASDITDDKMVRPFFREVLVAAVSTCRPFAHVYVCCDWRSYPSWWEVAKGTGITPKNCIVWDKGGAGLGANYANTHELLLFGWLLPLRQNMSQKITGGRQVNDSNIWRCNRVPAAGTTAGRVHNAQKPVDLVKRAIENSSEEGEAVADFFLGSGTTLVAAHKLGRRCFGFEIEPRNCDVAVIRSQQETGLEAVLWGDGRTFGEVAAGKAKKRRKSR